MLFKRDVFSHRHIRKKNNWSNFFFTKVFILHVLICTSYSQEICAIQHEECNCLGRVSYETNYQVLASVEVDIVSGVGFVLCSNFEFGVGVNTSCVHSFSPDCERFCRCDDGGSFINSTAIANTDKFTETVTDIHTENTRDTKTSTVFQTSSENQVENTTSTFAMTFETSKTTEISSKTSFQPTVISTNQILPTSISLKNEQTTFTFPYSNQTSTFQPIILINTIFELSTTPYSKLDTNTVPIPPKNYKLPIYLIIIIVLGALFMLILLSACSYYCVKKKLDVKERWLMNTSLTRIGRKSRLNKINHGLDYGSRNYVSTEVVEDIVYV